MDKRKEITRHIAKVLPNTSYRKLAAPNNQICAQQIPPRLANGQIIDKGTHPMSDSINLPDLQNFRRFFHAQESQAGICSRKIGPYLALGALGVS